MESSDERPVLLASGGLPVVGISVRPNASAPEEYAAEEVRRHLYEMIGAGPRLRRSERSRGAGGAATIFINDTTAAAAAGIDAAALALGPESYHLETRGGNVYLLGGGPRGVLYGACDLLEALGCHWFTPELSRVPRRRRVELGPLRRTESPAFEFRDMWNWDCQDPIWWVRNRMNGWYKPVPAYLGGHMTYELFVHSFYTLVPPEEFFASHPEYFSLINGSRRKEAGQLCLSNPDVLRIVTARAIERLRANPKASIISISQNDCAGYCECPQCRAVAEEEGAQSGPILRFVNAVAAETSKVFPDKLIDTLAYWYSLDAPRRTKPHPNVRVRLCSINCCQGHGYGTCDHPESGRFLRALEGWSRLTPQMYIWHYCTDFAHYPLPMPDFDEIHANINLYRKFGVYGVFMQGMGEEGGGGESMALRGYVISRLLWNPDQPVWPIVDEFLGACYGAAAPQVRAYLDTFHERIRRDRTLHPSLYDPPTSRLFDEESVGPADAALAAGEARVRGAERARVRLLRHGLTYARLYRAGGAFRREGDVFRGEATDTQQHAFEIMIRDWKKAGMLRIREGAPFDITAELLRNRLSPHRVEWLRGGGQEIAVIPDLGGRLLEWHAHGRQWLAEPDPDNAWLLYPMSEGYSEFAVPGMYTFVGWGTPFQCRRAGEDLVLSAKFDGGLRLWRRLSLCDGTLRIASRLENRAAAAQVCAWGAGLHLAAPDAAQVAFGAKAGPQRLTLAELPDGFGAARVLEGDHVPSGEWQVEGPGFRVTHRFAGEPMARAIVGRAAARGTVGLDLRTDNVTIPPGGLIVVRQDIRIETVAP